MVIQILKVTNACSELKLSVSNSKYNNYIRLKHNFLTDDEIIIDIKTKKITLVDTNSAVSAVSYATSVASNVGTVTGSVTTKNAANADTTKTGTFTLASDTMAVTANGVNGLKVDLTWGSF